MTVTIDARALRAANPDAVPCGVARLQPFHGQLRAKLVDRDGEQRYHVHGYATVYEQSYEMYDMFGPYQEVVSEGAGTDTLAASPDVAFLVNHRGVTMARTTNGTLVLREDATGLHVDAYLNPKRQDVKDLVLAIDDGDVTEMSFAFVIESGKWSPDYSEYRIQRYNIDRGDVSAVNYGANPYTSIAARSREILNELDQLPAGAARAALERLNHRQDLAEVPPVTADPVDAAPTGRSVGLIKQLAKL